MFSVELIGGAESRYAPAIQIRDSEPLSSHPMQIHRSSLDDLHARIDSFWHDTDFPAPLLKKAVQDAVKSDLLAGDSTETSSPLGIVSRGESEYSDLWKDSTDGEDKANDPFRMWIDQTRLGSGSRLVVAQIGDDIIGAMAYGMTAFIVPVSAETEVISIAYKAGDIAEAQELVEVPRRLNSLLPNETVEQLIVWRLYLGPNTIVIDGATPRESGVHRILKRATRNVGILVGRLAITAGKVLNKDAPDPTAQRRRRHHEARDPATANECADIRDSGTTINNFIIAIHGTMGCAMPLAAACRGIVEPEIPILRFEHDTWLPIHENANELASQLFRLGAKRVLLVAHSRGGLVARHAAEMLAVEAKSPLPKVKIITLGTPFLGTKLVDSVRAGHLGTRTLLGGLRALGGVAIDAATRIAGLIIRAELPRGIESMRPDSTYLSLLKYQQPENVIAMMSGSVDESQPGYNYGMSFGLGFAGSIFRGEGHDLIVESTSSSHAGAASAVPVNCDHFSYHCQPEFVEILEAGAHSLTSWTTN